MPSPTPAPAPPKAHLHPTSGSTLLPILHDLLPHSLPLYRRLQFQHRTPASRVLASFPPAPPDAPNASHAPAPRCFSAAFVDRSARPGTEAWLFLSSEAPGRCHGPPATLADPPGGDAQAGRRPSERDDVGCEGCAAALLAVMRGISELPPPPPPPPPSVEPAGLEAAAPAYVAHLADPETVLVGALHGSPARVLARHGCVRRELPGLEMPYRKFVFEGAGLPACGLPGNEGDGRGQGLKWGVVRGRDFALVRSRSVIPRTDAALALLPSVAVFSQPREGEEGEEEDDGGRPIAWAFLGLDASLTSLHVEPEWRGRGLAKAVAVKLFRDEMGSFRGVGGEGEMDGLKHADVALDNHESTGVCVSLGGKGAWDLYWVRVSLERVRDVKSVRKSGR